MAKRMYADVVMNGQAVNLSLRASTEKEARTKLQTLPEYRGVTEIIEISPNPPRREDAEEKREKEFHGRRRNSFVKLYTGSIY